MNSLHCTTSRLASALALVSASLASAPARAHDTWFELLPSVAGSSAAAPAALTLALGTGMQFPVQQVAVGAPSLARGGCRDGAGRALPLRTLRETPTALILGVAPAATAAAAGSQGTRLSCWGQQTPFEIELPADKVALYLREINPPAWVHAEWARLRSLGLPWKERYAKHARIELGRDDGAATAPVAMAMDVLIDHPAPRVGEPLVFQVLRDGQPQADQAVELRGDMSPFGLWRRTDAEGRVRFIVPLAGRWVLRGTDLRRSETRPDQFESRFFNLAFEARPRDPATAPADMAAALTAAIRSRAP